MEINMANDLSYMDLYAQGPMECGRIFGEDANRLHVLRIADPVLMTDLSVWHKLEPGLRDAISALYMRPERTVVYDGIQSKHHPDLYPAVWSANIDTLWFAQQLKPHLEGVRTILECGTGSGFLTQFSLYHGSDIKKAWATDINPYALKSLRDNCPDPRLQALLVDGDSIGVNEVPDLVICNPPYIPRPGAKVDNPYEGLKLIEMLLSQNYPNLLMNISSTAGDLGLGEHVAEKVVPLKVNVVTNGISPSSHAWLQWLIDHGRVMERNPEETGYRYWHKLRFYKITQ